MFYWPVDVSFQAYTIYAIVFFIQTIAYVGYAPIVVLYYLLYGLVLAVGYHCWDVVYSVYRDIKAEETENTGLPMKFRKLNLCGICHHWKGVIQRKGCVIIFNFSAKSFLKIPQ